MKNDRMNDAGRWLDQARADLEDAKYLLKGGRFNTACFTAQQAAEKALKAFLYFKGAVEVWGRSVADLCTNCAELETSFSELVKPGALLDKYYIPTRYPNGLPGGIPKNAFDEVEADRAVEIAKRIIEQVSSWIK
jgi:HEPN domain-containing protein